jgi:hypothetical protein
MSTLQTFTFWLEPDPEIPRFKRLQWKLGDVPVADVLLRGVHPWMGPNHHATLPAALAQRVNAETAKIADLMSMGHCYDIQTDYGHVWKEPCQFQRTLKSIQEDVYFVDDLTYMELLDIAKQRLRDRWSHTVARTLANAAHPGFQELRRFLKAKDRSIKLSSYDDIDSYNLAPVLSLEDFDHHDKLLIAEGIPTLNFRRASALAGFTDEWGRLRLVPQIRHISLSMVAPSQDPQICGTRVQWHASCTGRSLTFRPDLGNSLAKRVAATDIARRWRIDHGALVFQTTLDNLAEMIESGEGCPSFPSLIYASRGHAPTATVEVQPSRVQAFSIGGYPTSRCSGDILREVLREYGVSMTGNKDDLVDKLAKLAAEQYAQAVPKLNGFFNDHQLVRISASPSATVELPVLAEVRYLRNLVLTMFALRHMRGNAILEAGHENTTYNLEELARALLRGNVTLTGAFLRVT